MFSWVHAQQSRTAVATCLKKHEQTRLNNHIWSVFHIVYIYSVNTFLRTWISKFSVLKYIFQSQLCSKAMFNWEGGIILIFFFFKAANLYCSILARLQRSPIRWHPRVKIQHLKEAFTPALIVSLKVAASHHLSVTPLPVMVFKLLWTSEDWRALWWGQKLSVG